MAAYLRIIGFVRFAVSIGQGENSAGVSQASLSLQPSNGAVKHWMARSAAAQLVARTSESFPFTGRWRANTLKCQVAGSRLKSPQDGEANDAGCHRGLK